jgi:hypothetical protein
VAHIGRVRHNRCVLLAALVATRIFGAPAGARAEAGTSAGDAAAAVGPAASEPAASEPRDAYDAAAAAADAARVLGTPDRGYLDARGRLVAHPELGADALVARLDAVPPPTSGERKRLFDVLAEIGGAPVATRIAAELRRACAAESSDSGKFEAIEPWRPMLRDLGDAGRGALAQLTGDRDLPVAVRANLLDDLVGVTPDAEVAGLLVLAGRGHVELRRQLARSLRRRLRGHDALTRDIAAALERELDAAEPERVAAVIQLRAALDTPGDDAWIARVATIATDRGRPFAARVAALRAAAALGDRASAVAVLETVARASLPAHDQASEILAAIALSGTPPGTTAELVAAHQLERSASPRLAAVGWMHVPLRGDGWLDDALADPWPAVRTAALGRVTGPCARKLTARTGALVGRASEGADADATVQRAAIDALGRCADDAAFGLLRSMLDDDAVATELSGEAARELVRHFGERGADAVAKQLASRPERGYARRLAQALRHAQAPTPRVRDTLCAWVDEGGEVGSAARASAVELFGDDACDG